MHDINPIGIIYSPHKSVENMPIQPKGASEFTGHVILDEKYVDGLQDLDGFSHIYLFGVVKGKRGLRVK